MLASWFIWHLKAESILFGFAPKLLWLRVRLLVDQSFTFKDGKNVLVEGGGGGGAEALDLESYKCRYGTFPWLVYKYWMIRPQINNSSKNKNNNSAS